MQLVLARLAALTLALSACQAGAPAAPAAVDAPAAEDGRPAAAAVEVFRMATGEAGGVEVSGRVSTREARSVLLEELRRHWPALRVRGDVAVDAGAPALWVPEAVALLPFVAQVEGGRLTVVAAAGPSGGGVLTLGGRVADEAVRERIAADAAATVAPPFEVRSTLTVGLDDAGEPALVAAEVVASDETVAAVAASIRSALAGAPLEFEAGTAVLSASAAPALAAVAAALRDRDDTLVEIAAPGGATGSASLDREVATRRGRAIARALIAGGLDSSRVLVTGPAELPPSVVLTVRRHG